MQPSQTAQRYALAAFQLAQEQGVVDAVFEDLRDLRKLVREVPEMRVVMEHPQVTSAQRRQALAAVIDQHINPLTRTLLALLDEKDRLDLLPDLVGAFGRMLQEARGIEEAHLVSATPLDPAQLDRIRDRLQRRFGKTIELKSSVDPALLGGFRIRVRDAVLDYSMAARLKAFKQHLIHA